jgi:hypothetical protein
MSLYLFISLIFSPIAATIAFITTYAEYKKYTSKKKTMKHSLEMAGFIGVLFIVIGTFAVIFFNYFFPLIDTRQ